MIWTAPLTLLLSLAASLLFCMVVQRPLFMLYNRRSAPGHASLRGLWASTRHGVRTDLISACLLTAVPWVILLLANNIPALPYRLLLGIYTAVIAVAVALIVVADTALYDFWHFKLDSSALSFLRSLRGATASVSGLYLAGAAVAIVAVGALYFCWMMWAYALVPVAHAAPGWPTYVWGNLLMLVALAAMAVVVRGTGIRPNNPTMALFSPVPLLNHAAQCAIYTFVYSLDRKDPYGSDFRFYPEAEVQSVMSRLYPATPASETEPVLRTQRPNIVVIVWESLSAHFVEAVGGAPGITPCLNSLAAEGIVMTRMDCGSYLTDRGLISIFSGLPGQPNATVGKYPAKVGRLPGLPRRLGELGYSTAVIHGGDLTVRHKADYYLASGHQRLIAQADFPASAPRCKWGVHDEVTFDRLYQEIMRAEERAEGPWMMTLQTLSSHEPFGVPASIIAGRAVDNAFAYTDRCLGEFVSRLRATPAWDNTLIVVVGDHGVHYSSAYGQPLDHATFPRIPAILAGGAVTVPRRIDAITSQTDLAATLLAQMGCSHDEFVFSRDVLHPGYAGRQCAFHAYHDGVTLREPEGLTDINTLTDTAISGADAGREHRARAILQRLYTYIHSL